MRKTFLVMWGVVICRLLIPFSIPSRLSLYNILRQAETETMRFNMSAASGIPDVAAGTQNMDAFDVGNLAGNGTPAVPVSISPLTLIWLLGIGISAIFFAIAYIKCRREFRTALPVDSDFIALWQQEHPMRLPVNIRQSDRIKAPLTYGIFRPVILLPKATDWADEAKLRYILTHEYAHIRRFDTLTKLLYTAALCVHWFNPLVWVMYILANRDIELSCDEAVIRTFGDTAKSAYALTLIGLEEKKIRLAPLCSNFSKNAIEGRIKAIMKIRKTTLAGVIIGVVLVFGVTIFFTTSKAAAENTRNQTDNGTITQQTAGDDLTAAFDFDASGYIFIPDTYFSSENNTETLPFTSEQIQIFALIYGDHFIAAQVGDTLPSGIYVSNDGREAYMFDKKVDGSLAMTKYAVADTNEVSTDSYELVEENTIEPRTTAEFEPGEGTTDYAANLLNQLRQSIRQAICSMDKIRDSEVQFDTDKGTCTVALILTPEADLSDADMETITGFILKCTAGTDLIDLTADDIRIYASNDSAALDEPAPAAEWVWPVEGCETITSTFGKRVHPISGATVESDHICISGDNAAGAKVYAALAGTVLETGYDAEQGNYIVVTHSNGIETVYRHLKETFVAAGNPVAAGETIGTVGKTGTATGPCLAFCVRVNGVAVNPLEYYQ